MNAFRKALLGSAVVLAAGAIAGTASADVFVTATIDKDKDVTVRERIDKVKTATLDVTVERALTRGAEAEALGNQRSQGNSVEIDDDTLGGTGGPDGAELEARMTGSVLNNEGETQVNQDVGNMVNQANLVAVASVNDGESDPQAKFVDAQASAQQINGYIDDDQGSPGPSQAGNEVDVVRAIVDATITGSINRNEGVTQVNQNAGNINNQLNGVSLAVGNDPTVVALSEADLGQFNAQQSVTETNATKTSSISGSINNNSGVTQVNQSAGNLGNQGNVVAISASFGAGNTQ